MNSRQRMNSIGVLAIESYLARKRYEKIRKDRAGVRRKHPCAEEENTVCWATVLPLEEWCENCQYVQEYYLAMNKALNESNSVKQKLNHAIRSMIQP